MAGEQLRFFGDPLTVADRVKFRYPSDRLAAVAV